MLKKKKAFTLVELLVAMAIIGVLIGLAIFGLAAAQRVQRDTERKSTIGDLNIGMQTYYEKANTYAPFMSFPNVNTVTFCSTAACAPGATRVDVPIKGASISLFTTPLLRDLTTAANSSTTSGTAYCLAYSSDVVASGTNPGGYVFCADLENGQVVCSGPGAVKGNTITGCNLPGGSIP